MRLEVDFTRRINGEYKILDFLGSGSFGKVYRVKDRNGSKRAAKFVPPKYKDLIEMELKAMQKCGERRSYGTPYWYYFGKHGNCYVIVMDLLGKSIWKLHKSYRGLSMKSVLMIGIQLIHRLEKLHDRGFIHRDLKPDNFVIGRTGNDLNYVYLIDYGLALKYKDRHGHHKRSGYTRVFYGTTTYSAPESARFERQSRRSDLKSLLYNLVFLMKGSLPWEFQSSFETLETKESITAGELCHGLPGELKKFFRYLSDLGYSERPNYSKLSGYLETALGNIGYEADNKFEWND